MTALPASLRSGIHDVADMRLACRNGRDQSIQRRAVAKFDAARIDAIRLIEIARQADVRMPRVVGGTDDVRRPPQQRFDRHGIVGGNRHEG